MANQAHQQQTIISINLRRYPEGYGLHEHAVEGHEAEGHEAEGHEAEGHEAKGV